jgi:hypothetical protein
LTREKKTTKRIFFLFKSIDTIVAAVGDIAGEVGHACVSQLGFSQEATTESCYTRSLQTSFHFGNVNNNKKTIIGKKSEEEEDQREIITIQIPAFFFLLLVIVAQSTMTNLKTNNKKKINK